MRHPAQGGHNLEDINGVAIPADGLKKVDARRAELASGGNWDIVTGPINDQSGAVKLPAGKKPTDPELQRIDWYVQGVDVMCRPCAGRV